ncbi:MAG TPA: phosphoribosylformylglycinamidine cyclo-ligase [Bdellovibrionales bacterium]|nr:phosphoribosylformylglycinamidine cyclo-ligase [Bdellovibrionales bacterium]
MPVINYKSSGVDVEAGDSLVDWLKESGPRTMPHADRLVSGIGGFAAIFRAGFPEMKKPCLVSSTDGVGTKIKLASEFEMYEGAGQDLVAMCVNDLVCAGAQPLFFLDYYATGKLELSAAQRFLKGIRDACIASDCALIGGETAEMPGLYHGKDFDAAGFAVGIVDEDKILGAHRVSVGSKVIGLESSGFHSNGYSLLRKVFEGDLEKWRDVLMRPTHLYARVVLDLVKEDLVQAVANVTGGGMENLPRVMPKGCVLPLIDWAWPSEFLEVQDRSGLSREEMLKTLNCGVGLALFVDPAKVAQVEAVVARHKFKTMSLGTLAKADSVGAEPEVRY